MSEAEVPFLEVAEAIRLATDAAQRLVLPPLVASVTASQDESLIELRVARPVDGGDNVYSINIERCYTPRDFQNGVTACFHHLVGLDAKAQAQPEAPAP